MADDFLMHKHFSALMNVFSYFLNLFYRWLSNSLQFWWVKTCGSIALFALPVVSYIWFSFAWCLMVVCATASVIFYMETVNQILHFCAWYIKMLHESCWFSGHFLFQAFRCSWVSFAADETKTAFIYIRIEWIYWIIGRHLGQRQPSSFQLNMVFCPSSDTDLETILRFVWAT